jgi:hypothetical protein
VLFRKGLLGFSQMCFSGGWRWTELKGAGFAMVLGKEENL